VRVTAETFALGATFKGSLSHRLLGAFALLAVLVGLSVAAGAFLLWRRAASAERRAAVIVGVIAGTAIAVPFVAALGGADYFLHKNLIPVLPLLAVIVAVGLGCGRGARLGLAGAAVLVLAGLILTAMSFAIPSLRRTDVRQVSQELGPVTQTRLLVFVPRWELLLEQYQGPDTRLTTSGRAVREIDVFTIGDTLPPGTVPSPFRLREVEHGDTFTLFRFRSPMPVRVTPDELAPRTFEESGLRPIAVVQTRAAKNS
jgi:hypothetical protein